MSGEPRSGAELARDFREAVNMTARQLRDWLATGESREVGFTREGEAESVGHEMGGRIVELLERRLRDPSEEDEADMRKVVGYVRRHLAQRPSGEVEDTPWRRSLMNWGHDPLKGSRRRSGSPGARAASPAGSAAAKSGSSRSGTSKSAGAKSASKAAAPKRASSGAGKAAPKARATATKGPAKGHRPGSRAAQSALGKKGAATKKKG